MNPEAARARFVALYEERRRLRMAMQTQSQPLELQFQEAIVRAAQKEHPELAISDYAQARKAVSERCYERLRAPYRRCIGLLLDRTRGREEDIRKELVRLAAEIEPQATEDTWCVYERVMESAFSMHGLQAGHYAHCVAQDHLEHARLYNVVAEIRRLEHPAGYEVRVRLFGEIDLEILRFKAHVPSSAWLRLCQEEGVDPRLLLPESAPEACHGAA